MTALYAGLTLPCQLAFDDLDVVELPGKRLESSRRDLNRLSKRDELPDIVVAHDIPDLEIRTIRTYLRYGFRPVLVVHPSRNPEEAALLARGMGRKVPDQQEWTTRMMRVQNIVSGFGRFDVAGDFVVEIYAEQGVLASTETVQALVHKAMNEPPPSPDTRLMPA
jgi:hypothetical protein